MTISIISVTKCTLFPTRTPRWDGDCVHCSFLNILPGFTLTCPECHNTVCAGHIYHHSEQGETV